MYCNEFFILKVCYFQVEEDYMQCIAKQLKVDVGMVNSKLSKLAEKYEIIFIFDNVEEYDFIKKFICNLPEGIWVLTTSRQNMTDDNFHPIWLDPFSTEKAMSYVDKVFGKNAEITTILKILPYFNPDSIEKKLIESILKKINESILKNINDSILKNINDSNPAEALTELIENFPIRDQKNSISVHKRIQEDLRTYISKNFKDSANKE